MPRLEFSGNTDFVRYLGPYTLANKQVDWQGDGQKRMPSGKQILSPRARLLHRSKTQTSMEPEAEPTVTEPSHIKRFVDDRGISRGPSAHSKMWP